ncbi:MAG TPA: carboxypeptidase M32 [Gaiellaceae bacterium]|nr:carboxypeptidase M32 [Gaiellaceae bacterium]
MADALEKLKGRLVEVVDLQKVARILSWDQQTKMPRAGTRHRAEQMATLQRIVHERFTDPDVGKLLDELRPLEDSLDPDSDDAATIRLARRDYEKAVRVPSSLRAEMAHAAAQANPVWVKAKAESDFASFLPYLQRNVELKLQYVDYVAEGAAERYDVLLDDYEPQTTTAEVRTVFAELKPPIVELIAELRDREVDDSFIHGDFPPDRQRTLSHEVVDLFGHRPDSWRIDPTEHPFASGPGRDDVRITTHYHPDSLESLFSTMHEYGHGLYSHQQPAHLERLPVGGPCSLGIHESQSRLWENLVGRSLPFWRFFYPRLQEAYPEQLGGVELERFHRAVNRVKPGLIRIQADEVTYGMHVMLRFELEQDIVEGRVELADLPQRWNERMWDYLGVEVPDDGHGVLQDVHWSGGSIGYFSTYLLGTVASVQIWEAAGHDIPDLQEQVGRGEFTALREWLGEHIHALGRKFSPQETLRRATGSTLQAQPYLDHLRRTYAGS